MFSPYLVCGPELCVCATRIGVTSRLFPLWEKTDFVPAWLILVTACITRSFYRFVIMPLRSLNSLSFYYVKLFRQPSLLVQLLQSICRYKSFISAHLTVFCDMYLSSYLHSSSPKINNYLSVFFLSYSPLYLHSPFTDLMLQSSTQTNG